MLKAGSLQALQYLAIWWACRCCTRAENGERQGMQMDYRHPCHCTLNLGSYP